MPFAIGPIPSEPVGTWMSPFSYPILHLGISTHVIGIMGGISTHLSTAETTAAVPVPNTSKRLPFFCASTSSDIIIFLSDTCSLSGRPGILSPSIWERARARTLQVQVSHTDDTLYFWEEPTDLSRVTPGNITSSKGGVTSSTLRSGFLNATKRFIVPTYDLSAA